MLLSKYRSLFRKVSPLSSLKVETYYEEWHQRYLDAFGSIFQSARLGDDRELIKHILLQLNANNGEVLLDAGCGVAGTAIEMCKQKNLTIQGITISAKQCHTAKQNICDAKLEDHIKVTKGDFHYLNQYYDQQQFDGIYFLESLVHSDHPELVIEQAVSLLKPGGRIYIKDLFALRSYNLFNWSRIKTAVKNTNTLCALNIKPVKTIANILKRNGCKIIAVNSLDYMNHDIGNAFIIKNQLDIYEGKEPITYLDWSEIVAEKTLNR